MKKKRLNRDFFNRSAVAAAPEILGKYLVRRLPSGEVVFGKIIEVEAYAGREDLGSHASEGRRTKRTEVMFGAPGHAYVYFTYGMHWLLNVVCSQVDDPQAVLIRGLADVSGPARLTKKFLIDGKFHGADLIKSQELWLEDWGEVVKKKEIQTIARIGIPYAKEWKDKPLRFVLSSPNPLTSSKSSLQ
ncbi:MAG: DNA-3-methyladenine glycosylase [Patescibacteria group bacterium]